MKPYKAWPEGYRAWKQVSDVVYAAGPDPKLLNLVMVRASQISGCALAWRCTAAMPWRRATSPAACTWSPASETTPASPTPNVPRSPSPRSPVSATTPASSRADRRGRSRTRHHEAPPCPSRHLRLEPDQRGCWRPTARMTLRRHRPNRPCRLCGADHRRHRGQLRPVGDRSRRTPPRRWRRRLQAAGSGQPSSRQRRSRRSGLPPALKSCSTPGSTPT